MPINSEKSFSCRKAAMVCLVVLLCSLWIGCSQDVSSDDRFTGSWRMKKGRAHRIWTFRANGTWQSQVRKEGRLGKVISKQEEFLGTWVVKDNFLHMTATEAKVGDAWNIGETTSFALIEITEQQMTLKKPNGTIEKWSRVKSQKADGKEKQARAVSLAPIIVNLFNERAGSKEHFLCIELEFTFKPGMTPGAPPPELHPKVREATIFYLSSLTYSEVNTMDKVGAIKGRLLQLLNPYANNQIEDIAIQNITVTSRWKSVEVFLSQYTASPPNPDDQNQKNTKSQD